MKIDSNKLTGGRRPVRWRALMIAGLVPMTMTVQADDFAGLADPTQPAYHVSAGGAVVAKPMGPVLQSTFISANQRRAVISGKSYAMGDKFGGAVITDIQAYEVVMKKADRETRLRLLPRLVKETYKATAPANGREQAGHVDGKTSEGE